MDDGEKTSRMLGTAVKETARKQGEENAVKRTVFASSLPRRLLFVDGLFGVCGLLCVSGCVGGGVMACMQGCPSW